MLQAIPLRNLQEWHGDHTLQRRSKTGWFPCGRSACAGNSGDTETVRVSIGGTLGIEHKQQGVFHVARGLLALKHASHKYTLSSVKKGRSYHFTWDTNLARSNDKLSLTFAFVTGHLHVLYDELLLASSALKHA